MSDALGTIIDKIMAKTTDTNNDGISDYYSDLIFQGKLLLSNGSKELLLVDGAGHGTSFLVDRECYTKCVISFLEKYLEDF